MHVREDRLGANLEMLFQDIRYTFRTLWKNKGFAAVAVVGPAVAGPGDTDLKFSIKDIPAEGTIAAVMCPQCHEVRLFAEPGGK